MYRHNLEVMRKYAAYHAQDLHKEAEKQRRLNLLRQSYRIRLAHVLRYLAERLEPDTEKEVTHALR